MTSAAHPSPNVACMTGPNACFLIAFLLDFSRRSRVPAPKTGSRGSEHLFGCSKSFPFRDDSNSFRMALLNDQTENLPATDVLLILCGRTSLLVPSVPRQLFTLMCNVIPVRSGKDDGMPLFLFSASLASIASCLPVIRDPHDPASNKISKMPSAAVRRCLLQPT